EPLEDRTQTAIATSAKPTTMRMAGQARRSRRRHVGPRGGATAWAWAWAWASPGADTDAEAGGAVGCMAEPAGRVPTDPGPASRRAGGSPGDVPLPGPGVGEPLPGQLQGLGHDTGLGHRGHEVGVAGPTRQDMEVDVTGQSRAGRPSEVR